MGLLLVLFVFLVVFFFFFFIFFLMIRRPPRSTLSSSSAASDCIRDSCNTVVMSGEVSYERPVLQQLLCVCSLPNDSAKVFETLDREGAASATLTSVFQSNRKDAMRLSAKYHIKKKPGPDQ